MNQPKITTTTTPEVVTFTDVDLIREARILRSEGGSNPEYDRALVELVCRTLGLTDTHLVGKLLLTN